MRWPRPLSGSKCPLLPSIGVTGKALDLTTATKLYDGVHTVTRCAADLRRFLSSGGLAQGGGFSPLHQHGKTRGGKAKLDGLSSMSEAAGVTRNATATRELGGSSVVEAVSHSQNCSLHPNSSSALSSLRRNS